MYVYCSKQKYSIKEFIHGNLIKICHYDNHVSEILSPMLDLYLIVVIIINN